MHSTFDKSLSDRLWWDMGHDDALYLKLGFRLRSTFLVMFQKFIILNLPYSFIYLFIYLFFAVPCGLRDLSSLTRDPPPALSTESVES